MTPGLRDRLSAAAGTLGWTMGWRASQRAPERLVRSVGTGLADLAAQRGGVGVEQLRANLDRTGPGRSPAQLDALTRLALRSYARYWTEVLRLSTWSHDRIVQTVEPVNEGGLRDVLAQGNGAIVALPHMGNWDLAGAWACLTGLPVSTVAERLRPERLYERFVAFRVGLGMEVVPLSGAGDPLAAMRGALTRGRVVCLVADRAFGGGGQQVTLLDKPALLPGGPAALSRISKVPLIVAVASYRGARMRLAIGDPIEPIRGASGVATMTQVVADQFSAAIREAPQDWHMLQRVFVSDLAQPAAPARDESP